MSQENVEIVRAAVSAFDPSDTQVWEALSHPDVELDWSASRGLEAGVYRGRAETTRFIRTFETFQTVVIEPEDFIEAGDSVVVPNIARFRGRDGIETVARSALVYELRDGLIARVCMYQDPAEALEAAGAAGVARSTQRRLLGLPHQARGVALTRGDDPVPSAARPARNPRAAEDAKRSLMRQPFGYGEREWNGWTRRHRIHRSFLDASDG